MHVPQPVGSRYPVTRRDPLGHLVLEQLLRERGFHGDISTDTVQLETYRTDESIFSITPQIIVRPAHVSDVAIVTSLVAAETKRFDSLSLTPRGAGSGVSGGSLTDSIVLDMSALTACYDVEHKKRDEVHITTEAGVPWSTLQSRLQRSGFHIPLQIPASDRCTVGGAVGNNAAGAARLQYQHCADWVVSVDVVLADGEQYTIEPLTYKQWKALSKKKHRYASIVRDVFDLLAKNQSSLKKSRPESPINTAGYNVWDVLPQGMTAFKNGDGVFNPLPLVLGSQGTIGVVTAVTWRAVPVPEGATLVAVPIFDLADLGQVLEQARSFDPVQIEAFDGRTFDLALQHPEYFKRQRHGMAYYRTMLTMYTTYHVRYQRSFPELVVLIKLDAQSVQQQSAHRIAEAVSTNKTVARVISNPIEEDMLWLIHQSTYALAALRDYRTRPAIFLEDAQVPVQQLPRFITAVNSLLRELGVDAVIGGHLGQGHVHVYPLIDFTNRTTPTLIEKLSDRFYTLVQKHEGALCGEYNDGILRTARLEKYFTKPVRDMFVALEAIFDPDDIFNPGKKVNPRFNVRDVLRASN